MFRSLFLISILFLVLVADVSTCIAQDDHADSTMRQDESQPSEASADSNSITEKYLKSLARKKRESRAVSGSFGLILGGGFVSMGVSKLGDKETNANAEEAAAVYIGGGAVMGLLGFHDLTNLSKPEKEYLRISQIADLSERDSAAVASLTALRNDARKSRITASIAAAALGCLQLALASNADTEDAESTGRVLAGADFALSGLMLVLRSEEERMYNKFKRESPAQTALQITPYVAPNQAGIMATIRF